MAVPSDAGTRGGIVAGMATEQDRQEIYRLRHAVYADTDVVTTYEHPVQPDGSRERHTVS